MTCNMFYIILEEEKIHFQRGPAFINFLVSHQYHFLNGTSYFFTQIPRDRVPFSLSVHN